MRQPISLIILDVDGVLTDGALPLASGGEAFKAFCVRDGSAIQRWRAAGGRVAILSGRTSAAVRARAAELGIDAVVEGAADKRAALAELWRRLGEPPGATCYLGDDLPDADAMSRCGLSFAVADAHATVKRIATGVTRLGGGRGAVGEVIDNLMRRGVGPRSAAERVQA
ncbi:MAG: HAD hydrolase family protein [Phycisphaerae bacterium]